MELKGGQFLNAPFVAIDRYGCLPKPVLCRIVLTKRLPILMYGLECFS